ncbi:MAG: hypothetical protein FJW68_10235 [Actinobacteria bacterium]|nr:hypothetical protein [Actinomycetota bacterium]
MKKILILFVVLFPLFLGGCATEPPLPIIPPESIVITSTTVEEITATTVVIKTTVITSKSITVSFEYGVSDYINVVTTIPNPVVGGKMLVSAKISDLFPNTKYKYRIKTVGEITKYFSEPDFFFVTGNQLQIGNNHKNGIIISINPNLVAAKTDLTPTFGIRFNYFTATEEAKKYGEGYRLPDSTEMKLVKNAKELGILTNFVDPNYDSHGTYFTSTEVAGNKDWVFFIEIHGNLKGLIHKNSSASSRAVCSF